MLNEKYVEDLEKRWFKYKLKKFAIVGAIVLAVGSVFAAIVYVTIGMDEKREVVSSLLEPKKDKSLEQQCEELNDGTREAEESEREEEELAEETTPPSDSSGEPLEEEVVTSPESTVAQEENRTLITQVESEPSVSVPAEVVVKPESNITTSGPTAVAQEQTTQTAPVESNESVAVAGNLYKSIDIDETKKKKDIVLKPELSFMRTLDSAIKKAKDRRKPKQKSTKKIEISKSDLRNPYSLKTKFFKTGNISYALRLSEYYYNRKQYESSIRWAIEANEIDRSNYRSWVYFAKSKYRQGKKKDAKTALGYYLKNYKSKVISKLLDDIEKGKVK
jgi:tetratricopeptide (TPR) repeat protein